MNALIKQTKHVLIVAAGLLVGVANARVYQHVDAQTGSVTYSNIPPDGEKPEEVSAPRADSRAPTARASGKTAPSDFPRITAAVQDERDRMRLTILMDELAAEQTALATAVAKDAASEIVRRHRENTAALRREIDGVR